MPMKNLQGPQMKISELRALLDRTSSENIKRMLVEVYRALPKKTRENLAIDELLKNPAATRAGAKQSKALAHSVDIDDLEPELEEFLSDAYARNYFAPNRFVPKSERPKWRFKAKRFFKEINAAVVEPGSIEKASDLLEKLYHMLCYACDFVLFSAYDPFQSVGIAQTEFLDAVFGLKAEHLELGKFIDYGQLHTTSLLASERAVPKVMPGGSQSSYSEEPGDRFGSFLSPVSRASKSIAVTESQNTQRCRSVNRRFFRPTTTTRRKSRSPCTKARIPCRRTIR